MEKFDTTPTAYNPEKKAFNNIVDVIESSIRSFQQQIGREPNKLLMSQDVFDFIIKHANYLGLYLDDEKNSFMGLDVEIVLDKKGFIEVGHYTYNPITVNVENIRKGGIKE